MLYIVSERFNRFHKKHVKFDFQNLSDDSNDKKASKILDLLEDIDDDLEEIDVEFVKIDGPEDAKGSKGHIKLVLYERGIPQNYEGNIANKDAIIKWVQEETSSDEIEDITDEMLDAIIEKMEHVAVLFCKLI